MTCMLIPAILGLFVASLGLAVIIGMAVCCLLLDWSESLYGEPK